MRIPDIMKNRMSVSFEVFPPKADKPLDPLMRILDKLYTMQPDFISVTYGAGGSNTGRHMEICKAIADSGKTLPSEEISRRAGREHAEILHMQAS